MGLRKLVCEFSPIILSPIANYKDELHNLPFNMNTFYQMWKVKTPEEAKLKIQEQIKDLDIKNPKNLEEAALSTVGVDIYEKLIKQYVQKQWDRHPKDLPNFIIKDFRFVSLMTTIISTITTKGYQ